MIGGYGEATHIDVMLLLWIRTYSTPLGTVQLHMEHDSVMIVHD